MQNFVRHRILKKQNKIKSTVRVAIKMLIYFFFIIDCLNDLYDLLVKNVLTKLNYCNMMAI